MTEKNFPYPIPENWQWVKLKSIAEIVTGSTPSKKNPAYYGGNFPFFKPADLNKGRHITLATEYLSDEGKKISRIIPAGSIAVCCIGSIGKCGYIEVEGTTNQQINSIIPKINSLYVYYYCLTKDFVNELTEKSSATTISIVNKSKMENCNFPLPPIAEQEKIVSLLDNFFSKLDAAKKIVQDIVAGYELRRSAILHKAFTGELSAKFRAENNLSLDDWQQKILGDVLTLSKQKTNSFDEKLKYVGLENISKNSEKISYQSANGIKSAKNIFHSGDLLYGKLRPYLNKHGIPDFSGVCSTDILVFCHNELTSNEFINYFFNLPNFIEYVVSHSKGATLPRVSAKIILNYEINLPPLAEQKEIVRILDNLLDKEQRTKELAENVLLEIDLLKKSILARAFRGEL